MNQDNHSGFTYVKTKDDWVLLFRYISPFQYRWLKGYIYSPCYYHHQIGSIHLSHCYIFPWLCVWDVCYIIFCYLLHIHSGKIWEILFIIFVQFMMSANSRIRFGLTIVFVYLYITPSHYHNRAYLFEDTELIKCLSDIFCRVCEWDKARSLNYPLYNNWGCVFSVYPFPLWWLR